MPRRRPSNRDRSRAKTATTPESSGVLDKTGFLPKVLDRTVIALPLLDQLEDPKRKGQIFDVVIDVNLDFEHGRDAARDRVQKMIETMAGRRAKPRTDRVAPSVKSEQYVFASLDAESIRELVRTDTENGKAPGPSARSITSGPTSR